MSTEQTRAALTEWLADTLQVPVQLSEFSLPEAGASNETLLFDAHWSDATGSHREGLVARLAPTGPGVFPGYDLVRQYRVMEALADTAVPVPGLVGMSEDVSILGRAFYIMRRLPGRVIAENPPYHMQGWFHDAPSDVRTRIWRNAVDTVASVNSVDWRAAGLDFLLQPELGATPLAQQLAEYRAFLAYVEAKPNADHYALLHSTLAWLEANQPANEPVALCWGDAKIANLLIDGEQVSAALDWEMAHLGNPVDDLAWWFTLDTGLSEGIGLPRLEGLPGREQTIAQWAQATGASIEHLAWYELFGACKFGIIMASVGLDLIARGIFPRESRFDVDNPSKAVLLKQRAAFGLQD